jgi:hypothetical protein
VTVRTAETRARSRNGRRHRGVTVKVDGEGGRWSWYRWVGSGGRVVVGRDGLCTVATMDPGSLFAAVVGAVFGAITASFLCVVAERVPRGDSIGGRSQCACGRQLRNRENIPVLGWVLAWGRARCCGASIPAFYVLAEIFLTVSWSAMAVVSTSAPVVATVGAAVAAGALTAVGVRVLGESDSGAEVEADYDTEAVTR